MYIHAGVADLDEYFNKPLKMQQYSRFNKYLDER